MIRILKLWRDQWNLDIPSFYLELLAIRALSGTFISATVDRVDHVLHWLFANVEFACIRDPANTNNVVSDDLTVAEKKAFKNAVGRALTCTWQEFVW